MLKFITKLFSTDKIVSFILDELKDSAKLKIRTIQKSDGLYLNVFVSVFERQLIDVDIPLATNGEKGDQTEIADTAQEIANVKTLTLDSPVDEVRTNQIDPWGNLDKLAKELNETNYNK